MVLAKLLPARLKARPARVEPLTTATAPAKQRAYGRDFWELVVFVVFVVIYGIYLGQTFENKNKYYISLYLENQLTGGEWHPKKHYFNTVTSEDWLNWASALLVPATFPDSNYLGKNYTQIAEQCNSKYSPACAHAAPGFMADWGPIRVGKVRVRQLRMKLNAQCAIPELFQDPGGDPGLGADQGMGCVGPYTYGDEKPGSKLYPNNRDKKRKERTKVQIRQHGVHPRTGESIKYEEADLSLQNLMSAYWSVGTQENYAYGGHTVYLDSLNPVDEFQDLIDQTWFDRQTRGVWVEYTLYTPDADVLTMVQLGTIFTPTGDLVPEARFTHAALRDLDFMMDTPANQLYTLNQIILYVYVVLKLVYEVYCCYEFPHGWHHYFTTDVYNCIELANLICFILTLSLRLNMQAEFSRTIKKTMLSSNVEGRFDEPMRLRDLCLHYDRTSAINAILSILKTFKYVRFSKTLTLPVDTLMASMLRMNVLSVCIGILLIGWGVTMNMVVGYELSNYRSFMESILTLVKVVFGDTDFGELMELDNRMFALITFGMYCVMIFFIILSMFFAMVSAAQEAIEEANDDDDESVPRVLKDLAHFFRPIFKALGYVPIVGALVPDQRSLLLLINAESEDEEDGATAADEEEEEEVPNDPFDTLKSDSEDFLRAVSDPSVVVLEALQDIGASQKELQDLLRVSTARKRAVADRERIKSMESRDGSLGSRPPSQGGSLPPSRGASRGSVDFGAGLDAARRSRGSLDGPPPG